MQITELRFTQARDRDCLGVCQITLENAVILEDVRVISQGGLLKLFLWGESLLDWPQLEESLSDGLSLDLLKDFQRRLQFRKQPFRSSLQQAG